MMHELGITGSNPAPSIEAIWYRVATVLVVNKMTRRENAELVSASRALRNRCLSGPRDFTVT